MDLKSVKHELVGFDLVFSSSNIWCGWTFRMWLKGNSMTVCVSLLFAWFMLTQLFRAVSISWITRTVIYLALLVSVTYFISTRDSKQGSKNGSRSALAAFMWLSSYRFPVGPGLLPASNDRSVDCILNICISSVTGDEGQTFPVCSAFVSSLGLWLHPDQALTISWTLCVYYVLCCSCLYISALFFVCTQQKKID